jgi:hypothetical protein
MKEEIVVLLGLVLASLPMIVQAQLSLNVPNNAENTRFYNDVFNINRLALSIVSFDNGGNDNKGYGLKQMLEMLYNESANPLMVKEFNRTITIAKQDLSDPFSDPTRSKINAVNRNSNILQSRAFAALARYVLHQNGIIEQVSDSVQAPTHTQALSDLRSAFLKPHDWLLANSSHEGDQVKWTRTIGNYARALDLYLALENAYERIA